MPLMPMPPMPTKWIGPMSRGNFMEPPLLSSEPCRSCPRNPDAGHLSTGGRTAEDRGRREHYVVVHNLSAVFSAFVYRPPSSVLRLPGLDPPYMHRQVGEPVGG